MAFVINVTTTEASDRAAFSIRTVGIFVFRSMNEEYEDSMNSKW